MSRTYRRKNEKFYNKKEDYLQESYWLKWRGIPVGEASYYRDLRKFHSDAGYGNYYSSSLKWEESSKRRAKETILLSKVKLDWEYNPEFNKRYGNIWNWD